MRSNSSSLPSTLTPSCQTRPRSSRGDFRSGRDSSCLAQEGGVARVTLPHPSPRDSLWSVILPTLRYVLTYRRVGSITDHRLSLGLGCGRVTLATPPSCARQELSLPLLKSPL